MILINDILSSIKILGQQVQQYKSRGSGQPIMKNHVGSIHVDVSIKTPGPLCDLQKVSQDVTGELEINHHLLVGPTLFRESFCVGHVTDRITTTQPHRHRRVPVGTTSHIRVPDVNFPPPRWHGCGLILFGVQV